MKCADFWVGIKDAPAKNRDRMIDPVNLDMNMITDRLGRHGLVRAKES